MQSLADMIEPGLKRAISLSPFSLDVTNWKFVAIDGAMNIYGRQGREHDIAQRGTFRAPSSAH